jgi:hypothetical protein
VLKVKPLSTDFTDVFRRSAVACIPNGPSDRVADKVSSKAEETASAEKVWNTGQKLRNRGCVERVFRL